MHLECADKGALRPRTGTQRHPENLHERLVTSLGQLHFQTFGILYGIPSGDPLTFAGAALVLTAHCGVGWIRARAPGIEDRSNDLFTRGLTLHAV